MMPPPLIVSALSPVAATVLSRPPGMALALSSLRTPSLTVVAPV
jgi:hypothetical protein